MGFRELVRNATNKTSDLAKEEMGKLQSSLKEETDKLQSSLKEEIDKLPFFKSLINALDHIPNTNKTIINIPNINLSFPADLPSCYDIASMGHEDPRILIRYLTGIGDSFTSDDFIGYASDDIGDINNMLKSLEENMWIREKKPEEILSILYTVEELRTFLHTHDLKVSGKKEVLVKRLLENVPFNKFKRKYKKTIYELTDLAIEKVQEKSVDYDQAIINAVNSIKENDFKGAVDAYNAYDHKWGYIHAGGKPHTIFANWDVPHSRFNYIAHCRMNELQNSDEFKQDLRSFLLSALMRRSKDGYELSSEFFLINNEPIQCPGILDMYRQDKQADEDNEDFEKMITIMQEKINKQPNIVLGYYISKILYRSRIA